MTNAHAILSAAQGHMKDRAATYDKPEGERSMGAAVEAFKAVTGHRLTEEQGWLFMALLKAVRSQQGGYRADSYEDGAAYFALAGEAAAQARGKPVTQELCSGGWKKEAAAAARAAIAAAQEPYHHDVLRGHELYNEEGGLRSGLVLRSGGHELYNEEELAAWEEGEKRMDQIGPNGNDGEHYWQINSGVAPDIDPKTRVIVEDRNGEREESRVENFCWRLEGSDSDIIRWRLA